MSRLSSVFPVFHIDFEKKHELPIEDRGAVNEIVMGAILPLQRNVWCFIFHDVN